MSHRRATRSLVLALGLMVLNALLPGSHVIAATMPVRPHVVYVALGASDTVGVGATRPALDNWTAILARHLPPGSRYVNLGHSGFRVANALAVELPAALRAGPTVVTVWLAVNDINAQVPPATYGLELNHLLVALGRTHARVFVGNVPDLRLVPAYAALDPAFVNATVGAYNAVIARVVARNRAVLVDLYGPSGTLWGHPEYISRDGFHPTTRGYGILAGQFYRVMHRSGAI